MNYKGGRGGGIGTWDYRTERKREENEARWGEGGPKCTTNMRTSKRKVRGGGGVHGKLKNDTNPRLVVWEKIGEIKGAPKAKKRERVGFLS